jgi:LmbE family N-acetylglucosaminyl deacetylase
MKTKLAAILLTVILPLLTIDGPAQVLPEYDRGAGALSRQLQRLQTTASVLHTGAHPDDEDSALIAFHARHDNARTAYLSLTRGSGGQNIIGTEQSDLLGVIRTEELLQARRLDGANQYFTRAVDFGFSKQREEGARLWDEGALLSDMVRVIRTFRPLIIVSRWNGTASDGHGHHQFAGYLTPLALDAAADPARFPDQIEAGLLPWQVSRLYVGERSSSSLDPADVLITDTGQVDPVTGRSYFQIGMRGRSQQKSQQMGSLELHGTQSSLLRLATSNVDALDDKNDVFAGIDTSLSAIVEFEKQPTAEFIATLDRLERQAAMALSSYRPLEPAQLVASLSEGLAIARSAQNLAHSPDALRLLKEKVTEFQEALLMASGISIDALANQETVVPGDALEVAIRVYHLANASLDAIAIAAPDGWETTVADIAELSNERRFRRREQPDADAFFNVRVPSDALASEPYWLEKPRQRFIYDWSAAEEAQSKAFAAPLLTARVNLVIGGQQVSVSREVQHREVDRVRGELRRRLDVVPAISLEPATDLEIVAANTDQRRYEVLLTVRNNAPRQVSGDASFNVPSDWAVEPQAQSFSLAASPATTTLAYEVTLPGDVNPGAYLLTASANADGVEYRQAMREISYPHIHTHRDYTAADVEFAIIDVEVAPVRIGYVMGSGDKVPEALRLLDLDVTLLDDEALVRGDLSVFDTIVIGIRASQTREAYVANNGRLLEFVEQGGAMIVQYQQPDFAARGLAPYPVAMERNIRVVDETAPVTIIAPDHPVFNFPNRIGPADFEGWIQERNNYNITEFDPDIYIPLTESHDPGEPASEGGMLYAKIGEGHYVYTAYSWFRQLPNGTPGGYRIFANLLSLPAAPE